MSPAPEPRGIFEGRVIARRIPCREHFEVTLDAPQFSDAQPGQFVQILCRPNDDSSAAQDAPMLRRPFSIAGMRAKKDAREIDIMGRIIGPGTAWLGALNVGDTVNILGPLGRGFSMPQTSTRAIVIAGGIGLPPIRWLSEILNKNGRLCESIYGAQSRELIPLTLTAEPSNDGAATLCADEFSRHQIPCAITTDDGSCGLRGRVTDVLARYLNDEANRASLRVFACGPEPMLRAVALACASANVPCELAMERVMGCGMGTCQSCVIPVRDVSYPDGWRYALCCSEGPVMRGDAVIWSRH